VASDIVPPSARHQGAHAQIDNAFPNRREAVCAVEATARALSPSNGNNLPEILDSLSGSDPAQIPKAIIKTFDGLYGFRNGGDGVAHGGATGGAATKEIAEYALAVAASQIVLLVAFEATLESDLPF
jgi:hypothetical protein